MDKEFKEYVEGFFLGLIVGGLLTLILLIFTGEVWAGGVAKAEVLGIPSSLRPVPEIPWKESVRLLDSPTTQGSGVVIGKGKMLTAAHVVSGEMWVSEGGKRKEIKVLWKDEVLDLALVAADVDCPCAKVGEGVMDGRGVVAVGFPMAEHTFGLRYVFRGELMGEGKYTDGQDFLVSTTLVIPGMSGGGLFQEQGGRMVLVGVISGYPLGLKNRGFGGVIGLSVKLGKEVSERIAKEMKE